MVPIEMCLIFHFVQQVINELGFTGGIDELSVLTHSTMRVFHFRFMSSELRFRENLLDQLQDGSLSS